MKPLSQRHHQSCLEGNMEKLEEIEKVYSFKYVGESELQEASDSVIQAALLVREASSTTEASRKQAVHIDELFLDSSLQDYLFQAGSPFVLE